MAPRAVVGSDGENCTLDLAVWIGGFKASGIGHELGEEASRHHTRLKAAWLGL